MPLFPYTAPPPLPILFFACCAPCRRDVCVGACFVSTMAKPLLSPKSLQSRSCRAPYVHKQIWKMGPKRLVNNSIRKTFSGAVKYQKALPLLPLTTQNVLKTHRPAGRGVLIHFVWLAVVQVMFSDILLHPKTFCGYYC